ncbi:MAG: hypothetical protein KBG29_17120 [Pseudomonadales bacterium]|jgi:hypothetical protein|nr:hypothetical protein [Pseudomonadales bacterium]MBP9035616.1 hypothetical protein [Pseudomonadales bacterium]
MNEAVKDGTQNVIDGKPVIYYDGYWIRYYAPPENTLPEKKLLIDQMTKRAFHHTEEGINTPGRKLGRAREAWQTETDPARKRVNAAMLAGALFNRATDLFTTIVELGQMGVEISMDNELMKQCGECFKEALDLGKYVKHYSGEEGIDELWGEPFKAFTLPIATVYESRYMKVARAMRDIDGLAEKMEMVFAPLPGFANIGERIRELAAAAKLEAETMKSDPVIFRVWPRFVAACEAVVDFRPVLPQPASERAVRESEEALRILCDGRRVIEYLAGARVPMPKTTAAYHRRCDAFLESVRAP